MRNLTILMRSKQLAKAWHPQSGVCLFHEGRFPLLPYILFRKGILSHPGEGAFCSFWTWSQSMEHAAVIRSGAKKCGLAVPHFLRKNVFFGAKLEASRKTACPTNFIFIANISLKQAYEDWKRQVSSLKTLKKKNLKKMLDSIRKLWYNNYRCSARVLV